jgi:hypothetical protein
MLQDVHSVISIPRLSVLRVDASVASKLLEHVRILLLRLRIQLTPPLFARKGYQLVPFVVDCLGIIAPLIGSLPIGRVRVAV